MNSINVLFVGNENAKLLNHVLSNNKINVEVNCKCEKNKFEHKYDIIIFENEENSVVRFIRGRVRCIFNSNIIWFSNKHKAIKNDQIVQYFDKIVEMLDAQPFISSNELSIVLPTSEKKIRLKTGKNEKSACVIVGINDDELLKIKNLIKNNFVAFYSFDKERFVDFEGNDFYNQIDHIYAINFKNTPANKSGIEHRFGKAKVHYIGDFGTHEEYNEPYNMGKAEAWKMPTVLITSIGQDIGKFSVLTELSSDFQKANIPAKFITSNPVGHILKNMEFVCHPYDFKFVSTVNLINEKIEGAEEEIVFIDVPGSCCKIDNLKSDFGGLLYAHLQALSVDMVILCVNAQISTDIIERECNKLYDLGVPMIVIVETNNLYMINMISKGKMCTYQDNLHLKRNLKNVKFILEKEMRKGVLFEYIIKAFTSQQRK